MTQPWQYIAQLTGISHAWEEGENKRKSALLHWVSLFIQGPVTWNNRTTWVHPLHWAQQAPGLTGLTWRGVNIFFNSDTRDDTTLPLEGVKWSTSDGENMDLMHSSPKSTWDNNSALYKLYSRGVLFVRTEVLCCFYGLSLQNDSDSWTLQQRKLIGMHQGSSSLWPVKQMMLSITPLHVKHLLSPALSRSVTAFSN